MNAKQLVTLLLLLIMAGGLYLFFKPHRQDPHYFAAACVVLNDMSSPGGTPDFMAQLQNVIINENSSYAVNKVRFDPASARQAIERYQHLSASQKSQTKQSMTDCLQIMMPAAQGGENLTTSHR